MRAGPLKIAAYQVRDPETGAFSKNQFHMTYDNTVMAVLDESSAKLFASFITDFQTNLDKPLVVTDRIKELLEHNNVQLEENRAQKAVIRKLLEQVQENHKHHIDYDDTGSYAGSAYEADNLDAIKAGKEILNVGS
ncbi:hypothetical protein B9J07_28070 [Sinorhizobium sp. LM21]|nr:hypothetical protein B9J07_28070 [Sinorhizobium sp. LM21]